MVKRIEDVIKLKNGKILNIVPLDACKLLIDTSSVAFIDTTKNEENDVISVKLEGDESFSIGDEISIRVGLVNTVYKIKTIVVEKGHNNVIVLSSLPTKTNIFLLPLLNKTKIQLKYNTYCVNSYISKCHKYLHVVYRYTGTESYKSFEQFILSDKMCIGHDDYDKHHVTYTFKIPDEFMQDIDLFFQGKYSKFSKELKHRILKFHGENKSSVIYHILNKSPSLKRQIEKELNVVLDKDAELATIPIEENEIYKLN